VPVATDLGILGAYSIQTQNIVTWRLKAEIVESDRKLISYATIINRARSRDNRLPWDYYTWLPWKHSTRHIGYCGTGGVSVVTRT
jgi:hypothetical protein